MIFGIPSDGILAVWDEVEPILQRAVDKCDGNMTCDDIKGFLLNRDMQLWVWKNSDIIEAICVTQIVSYPRKRVCQFPFIAGKSLKIWKNYESVLVQWAKDNGCTQLEGFARDGWLRVLKDWRKVWTTIRRDI